MAKGFGLYSGATCHLRNTLITNDISRLQGHKNKGLWRGFGGSGKPPLLGEFHTFPMQSVREEIRTLKIFL